MDLIDTELEEVKILVPRRLGDERGFSSEAWNARILRRMVSTLRLCRTIVS